MVEIILFQLRERALFADIDMPAYCLNWFFLFSLYKIILYSPRYQWVC
jgi:hypothetical protein